MITPDLETHLRSVAHEMADAARVEALAYFRMQDTGEQNKAEGGSFDPVTLADQNAEQAMRAILKARRPDDGIIGEEFGVSAGTTGLNWVLDPIDGTRAFICGATSWGVLISVEQGGAPVFGMIDQPYNQERFEGGFGMAEVATRGGPQPLKVRGCADLSAAVLASTFPEVGTDQERAAFDGVKEQAKLTRYGLDCYGYALLAMGQLDLVIEAGLNRYDISAPIAVVEAAGGIVTNWQGDPVSDGGQVIACGDLRVHAQALELLNR